MSLRRVLTPALCRSLQPRSTVNSTPAIRALVQMQMQMQMQMHTVRRQLCSIKDKDSSKTKEEVVGAAEESPISDKHSAESAKKEVARFDADEYDDYYEHEEPQTPKEKFAFYAKAALRWAFLCAGLGCLFLIGKELFPGRLGEQSIFSEVFDILQGKDDIREVIGTPMKAYGRDIGRNEGRRNHVDSYKYTASDGSDRVRVRFHVEGPRGKVRVWAEVSSKMPSTEFVYIICQEKGGRVITIVDNRDALGIDSEFADKDNSISNAVKALLGGGK